MMTTEQILNLNKVCGPHIKVSNSGRLVDIIQSQKCSSVLVKFPHGLGDVMMFMPVLDEMRKRFPHIEFAFGVEEGMGYEDIVPGAVILGKEPKKYDVEFNVKFYVTEPRRDMTKASRCAVLEMGIPPPIESHPRISATSPMVALHFHSTCMPDSLGITEDMARQVWEAVKEEGYIPIETHVEHKHHHPNNSQFKFVDRSLRGIKTMTPTKLAGLIAGCKCFIGCVSGNWHVAVSVLPPERVLLIETIFPAACFTNLPVASVKTVPEIREWIKNL